jgi:hypothetical protein
VKKADDSPTPILSSLFFGANEKEATKINYSIIRENN